MTDDNKTPGGRKKAGETPKQETRAYLGADGMVTQQGRQGGRLSRDIGTRDEMKRAQERPAGATRVRGSDTEEDDT